MSILINKQKVINLNNTSYFKQELYPFQFFRQAGSFVRRLHIRNTEHMLQLNEPLNLMCRWLYLQQVREWSVIWNVQIVKRCPSWESGSSKRPTEYRSAHVREL